MENSLDCSVMCTCRIGAGIGAGIGVLKNPVGLLRVEWQFWKSL